MEKLKLWQKITVEIKHELDQANFKTWFGNCFLKEVVDDILVITAPSAFIKEQVTLRYLDLLTEAAEKILGKKVKIELVVESNNNHKTVPVEEIFEAPAPSQINILNPKYTLENFVVGMSNNVAFAAAQAVVQNPGISYNPLFIYGGTGVGKTHLMLGIGHAILKKNPALKVIYCSSEQFTNDFVSAIQNHRMGDLRAKYRLAQLLLIDDIQFFSGREGTQEEFFHTFNELQSKNSQMIITSDRSPHEIAKLEDRLRSRFAGGLMVDIQPPDFDTRVAILKAKANEWGTTLPEEALKLIAASSEVSIRELEGKLLQIIQVLKAQNLPTTTENITLFLNKTPKKLPALSHQQVLTIICHYFNLANKDLIGPKRQKELVLPRHLAMYILSEELGMTVERIGQILGGRDHTTVMHARDKIKNLITKDKEMQQIFIEIKQELSTN
ncbi:MAG: chromosomal replication initiator protein DnaA [Candidatus Daviesbacteria bacterium]|nr:MAG: chromosomal replication initiator protein DnaA [Candidatus Daviesbacteria bacterium]